MAKYVYPAVFTQEDNGQFSVNFPDLESCYTSGDNLQDAIFMSEDILAYVLFDYERDKKVIPVPTHPSEISLEKGEFINFIIADTLDYQKRNNNKSVKKTLTIPEWLNELAISDDINFSQVLQEALLKKVGK
ncbi:MAG: type II toxin-antitoxin system HicB family antitoxin [Lachnospiraceae bacterium]|nr:type II toxin-antitoxin system HicB family antitoxin [Lachnospiraceae bacterium]